MNISLEHSTVLPFALSLGSTSAMYANYHAYICFYFAYCLFLVSSCSSTSFNYFIMLPVSVDLPESTWPMKIKFADSRWKASMLAYLFTSHYLALNYAAVTVGSSFRTTTYSYFGYFTSFYFGFCFCYCTFLFYFLFFLSLVKS